MILPDHPTPVRIRTHSSEPVPYIIYASKHNHEGVSNYNETSCSAGKFIENGWDLMQYFINSCN